jgi:hypothetical protein
MSRPKRPDEQRRLLLAAPGQSVSEALAWMDWAAPGTADRMAAALGRLHYLEALTRHRPRILRALARIADASDTAKIDAWAAAWALPAWIRPWADATLTLSRGRYWCHPTTTGTGVLVVGEAPPVVARTPTEIKQLAPLVDPRAFRWLARYQCGDTFTAIARWDGSTPSNVRRDCHAVARVIGVSLRATSPGQPKKRRRPAPSE